MKSSCPILHPNQQENQLWIIVDEDPSHTNHWSWSFWETCATWELVMEDELYGIIGGDSVEVLTYHCNTYMNVIVTFGFS